MQRQAFGQIAGEHAGRIEFLQACQHALDPPRGAAEPLGGAVKPALQIARLVQLVQQMKGNHPVRLLGQIGTDLFNEVLAQGARTCRSLIDPRQIAGVARAITVPPRLRVAAEIAADLDRAVAVLARSGAPMIAIVRCAIAGQRRGKGLRGAVDRRCIGLRLCSRRRPLLRLAFTRLQKRVLLDLGLDERAQLQVGQLQHLDRLLQLRSHDQSLALAQFKPLREADSVHKKLRSEPGL